MINPQHEMIGRNLTINELAQLAAYRAGVNQVVDELILPQDYLNSINEHTTFVGFCTWLEIPFNCSCAGGKGEYDCSPDREV